MSALVAAAVALTLASCGGDGEAAPDFELTLFANAEHSSGDTARLSDFEGMPVVLNFWFPSCPPCVAEMPDFELAHQRYKSEGVRFIGVQLIGLDTAEDGQAFVERLGVNYMLGPDRSGNTLGGIVKDYAVAGFPTTVFIDRRHRIARQWTGSLDLEKLEEFIAEIL